MFCFLLAAVLQSLLQMMHLDSYEFDTFPMTAKVTLGVALVKDDSFFDEQLERRNT